MKNKELHSEFTFQIEPKHYFKHNYLTYCNDVLVSMLKYADEEKMASVSIDLGNGENIRFLYKGIIINHNKNRANLH